MKPKLCIVVCGNFYKEIKTIVEKKQYKNVIVSSFPSECVTHQKVEYEDLQKLFNKYNDVCSHYEVVCNSGCVNVKNIKLAIDVSGQNVHITDTGLCFGLLMNRGLVNQFIKAGKYLVTPGWLEKWRHYIIDVWKFNETIAKMFFRESTAELLLLDTGVYGDCKEALEAFSKYVDRPYQILNVGLDYMTYAVDDIVNRFEKTVLLDEEREKSAMMQGKLTDYVMIFDLFSQLTKESSEQSVIQSIIDLTRMLFGAQKVRYAAIEGEKVKTTYAFPSDMECSNGNIESVMQFQELYRLHESGAGFLVRIENNNERIGMLCVDEIPRKEHVMRYLNTFLSIRDVCGLAIRNARIYSDFVRSEELLSYQKSYFEQLFWNSPEAIVILDKQLRITDVNNKFAELFHYTIDELKALNYKDALMTDAYFEEYKVCMQTVLDGKYSKLETKRLTKEKDEIDVEMLAYPIMNHDELIGIYIIYSDITERKKQEKMIHQLAFYDALTGLSTRRVFNDRLRIQLSKSDRNEEHFAVVFADLNKFKSINDTFGHEGGDKVLIEAAKRLSCGIRESDTVARMGGDEFTMIFTNIKEKDSVPVILDKIMKNVTKPCNIDGSEIPISMSVGVAIYPDDGENLESLLKKADEAMYFIKKTGRCGYKITNGAVKYFD